MPEDDYYEWDDHSVPMLDGSPAPPLPKPKWTWLAVSSVLFAMWLISLGW